MLTEFIDFSRIYSIIFITIAQAASAQSLPQTVRDGKIFRIFQFPVNQIPRIDGKVKDWEIVPSHYIYETDELNDTEDGIGTNIDDSDLQVKVFVGWVKGLDKIYFLYEAYDDFWDFGRFNSKGYQNDIFELVVDGDFSSGPFIFNTRYPKDSLRWDSKTDAYLENHLTFSGVHAQNYHIFTPPVNNAWALVWGSQPWIAEFPYANYAYSYDFQPGDSGHLILEGWITPFDYAPHSGPEDAVTSKLYEGKTLGLSWSILDFDGEQREGHLNLSHDVRMVKDASYLCAFQLMPMEPQFLPEIKAEWTFKKLKGEPGLVAFTDLSLGNINRWIWDFGDGKKSFEQHPIHQFNEKGAHKVITLTVEGPSGSSKRTRFWEVVID